MQNTESRYIAGDHIAQLDGWRAVSILFVVTGHWLPLGPHWLGLNEAAATTGMALFFCLSGFLITRVLLNNQNVPVFLIRRLFRIVPLAWLTILILVIANRSPAIDAISNFGFFANIPPDHLIPGGHHLWSLCVEVQFYIAVALAVAVFGPRGLWIAPIAALSVTVARIIALQPISIVTWHRIDEILAGATLALILYNTNIQIYIRRFPKFAILVVFSLLIISGIPNAPVIPYLRPYLAAITIGISIFSAPDLLNRALCSKEFRYIASISFSVYVIHGVLGDSWLGSGTTIIKYLKRPLLALITVILSHYSTFWFENPMINIGKKLSSIFYKQDIINSSRHMG